MLSDEEIRPVVDENVRFVDSETNLAMNLDAGISVTDIYQQAFEGYMKEVEGLCAKYRAEHIVIDTSRPIEDFIRRLASIQ